MLQGRDHERDDDGKRQPREDDRADIGPREPRRDGRLIIERSVVIAEERELQGDGRPEDEREEGPKDGAHAELSDKEQERRARDEVEDRPRVDRIESEPPQRDVEDRELHAEEGREDAPRRGEEGAPTRSGCRAVGGASPGGRRLRMASHEARRGSVDAADVQAPVFGEGAPILHHIHAGGLDRPGEIVVADPLL